MSSLEVLLREALDLPSRKRARLARELLRSLDGGEDGDATETWTEELRRRLQGIKDGTAELVDWEDVRARLAARRASRT